MERDRERHPPRRPDLTGPKITADELKAILDGDGRHRRNRREIWA